MKILLVEDDQVDAMAFTRAVSTGAPQDRVDVVKDGEEALDFLREESSSQ
jgi:CheY-like chemotaxis protein